MRIRLQPYKAGSASARVLSRALGIKRLRLVRTRFKPRPTDVILNWGSTELLFPNAVYINHPHAVARASDKLAALVVMDAAGVCVTPYTADPAEAQKWQKEGHAVVARTMLRASAGRGIVIVEPDQPLVRAPLYTRYVKKYDEYRVHVWAGQVIDIQQKRRRRNEQGVDQRVRNSAGGWVFCREEIQCPEVVTEQAVLAVKALGLDFGAADCGFTRKSASACIYEVNTAPGIEGATEGIYTRAGQDEMARRRGVQAANGYAGVPHRAPHRRANEAIRPSRGRGVHIVRDAGW